MKDEPFQIVIQRCKLQPGFNLAFSSDSEPGVFDMNVSILREADSTKMISMIKY